MHYYYNFKNNNLDYQSYYLCVEYHISFDNHRIDYHLFNRFFLFDKLFFFK